MSKTPGPVAWHPVTVKGSRSSVPSGKTVSWCPRISTLGSPPPDQRTCGPPGLSTHTAWPPRRLSTTPATASADAVRASASRDGDSTSTSFLRSSIIASTLTGPRCCVVMPTGY